MKLSLIRLFLYSAGLLLLITAVAKLIGSSSHLRIMQTEEPVLGVSIRFAFMAAAIIESVVSFLCFFGRNPAVQLLAVAWLATSLFVYRIGLMWIGYAQPCGCLGTLEEAMHMSPQMADNVMKGVLAYLLGGSYAGLISRWQYARNK